MIERLSVVAPGLLAAIRAGESRHPVQAVDSGVLRQLLARSQQRQPVVMAELLATTLGWSPWQDAAVVAQQLALPSASAWLFAAPVLLRPEHAGIYLLGSRPLQLTMNEAEQHCAELNAWLQQDGMKLYPISSDRWLLALPQPTGLQWPTLADAIGVDLRQVWPQGEGSLRWQSRLTEWQMLLNQSALNQARQQRGERPLHALWLWGNETRQANARTVDAAVLRLTQSQALLGSETATVAALLSGDHRHALLVDDRLADAFMHGDVVGYQQIFSAFTNETLQPVLNGFQRGDIAELVLYPDDGYGYLATQRARWRFWQRAPLPDLLRSR
jgi:hypothetical protein